MKLLIATDGYEPKMVATADTEEQLFRNIRGMLSVLKLDPNEYNYSLIYKEGYKKAYRRDLRLYTKDVVKYMRKVLGWWIYYHNPHGTHWIPDMYAKDTRFG